MKSLIKRVSYKILVISMITVILSFFSASSVVEAKLTLEEDEFYYTGTQDAEITWEASIWQRLVTMLSEIANFLLGIMMLALRSVVVGWIEVMEIILTALLGVEMNYSEYIEEAIAGKDAYTQQVVNIEKIIFNEVDVLDINIFKSEAENAEENPDMPSKSESSNAGESDEKPSGEKILNVIKDAVAKWYVILRLIVIAFTLILLIFIGIKMAISTVASEKSVYKQMLVDWVVGMVIVFMMHYFMVIIINVNEGVVKGLEGLVKDTSTDIEEEYQYGDEKNKKTSSEIETTLYESARTRAYSINPIDGFTGTIIYGALVYYAWKFALIYFRRLLNIILLTIISPVIAASYAFNKAMSGKAKIFSNWLKEYIMNVIIQLFHVIIYVTFISIALRLSLVSLVGAVMALMLLNFMSKSDKLLRELFNISGGSGSLFAEMADKTSFKGLKAQAKNVKNMMIGGAVGKAAMKLTGRVITKPVRKATEVAFVDYMKKKATSEKYQNRKREKEKKIGKLYEEYFASDEVAEKRKELETKETDLAVKKAKLQEEKNKLIEERDKANDAGNQDRVEELAEQIEAKEKEQRQNEIDIQNNQKEIGEFENSVQNEFLDYYVRSESSWDAVKENVGDLLFDPEQYLDENEVSLEEIEKKALEMFPEYQKYKELLDDENASEEDKAKASEEMKELRTKVENKLKYTAKKTKREGGANYAFWRKKKSGVGKIFFDNAKLDKILGLTSDEKKILKQEFDFAKSTVKGVVSGIAGVATLGVSPGVSLILLSQAATSRIETSSRMRQLRNGPSRLRYNYKFKEFNLGAQKTISEELEREIKFAESQLTKKNAKAHRKIANGILNGAATVIRPLAIGGVTVSSIFIGMPLGEGIGGSISERTEPAQFKRKNVKVVGVNAFADEQLNQIHEKKIRDSLKVARKQLVELNCKTFEDEYKYEYDKYRRKLKNESNNKSEEDLLLEDELSSENTIKIGDTIIKIEQKSIPEVKFDENTEHSKKVETITETIKNNKIKFIQNAIVDLAVSKGVTDIENLFISDVDNIEIRESIKHPFEAKGDVKKGEVKIDRIISNQKIKEVYENMVKNKSKGNDRVADKIVEKACLEYMEKNGIDDPNDLKTEMAKQEIEEIIKSNLMSKTSKKSFNVIRQMNGGGSSADYELPSTLENIASKIKYTSKKMKKKKVSEVTSNKKKETKEQLVERRVIREENEVKSKLERAVYTGEEEQLDEESQLKMLFLLSELQKQNREAYKVEGKTKKTNEKTLNEMKYFKRRKNSDNIYDTSEEDNEELMPREEELNILLHGKKDIINIINS